MVVDVVVTEMGALIGVDLIIKNFGVYLDWHELVVFIRIILCL